MTSGKGGKGGKSGKSGRKWEERERDREREREARVGRVSAGQRVRTVPGSNQASQQAERLAFQALESWNPTAENNITKAF